MIEEYLYGAYGSNLSLSQMARRCPDAQPVGTLILSGFSLVFRGVADIEPNDQGKLAIGLWRITESCEEALDMYEGFPNLYSKIYERTTEGCVMMYKMNSHSVRPPSYGYLAGISGGYEDFDLPYTLLTDAVKHSWANEGS